LDFVKWIWERRKIIIIYSYTFLRKKIHHIIRKKENQKTEIGAFQKKRKTEAQRQRNMNNQLHF